MFSKARKRNRIARNRSKWRVNNKMTDVALI
jgi:hypothetical protein